MVLSSPAVAQRQPTVGPSRSSRAALVFPVRQAASLPGHCRSSAWASQETTAIQLSATLRSSSSVSPAVGASLRPRASVAESQAMASDNTTPSPEVLKLWRSADAVCFDVDSTVCTDEGIDELAAYCGKGEEVAAWTTKAMTGNVLFQDALAARLDIMKPSATDLQGYLSSNPPKLSPGIKDLVAAIRANGADVYLISGGFRQMIEPVAAILGVPKTQIFANRILFDPDTGKYAGFDDTEPTSRAGGKATAIETIKAERGFKTLIMLGDGATDLEARRPGGADAFIGYGGVQVREKVKAGADWFVCDFDVLIQALKL